MIVQAYSPISAPGSPRIASAVVFLVAMAVLTGWAFDIRVLQSIHPHWVSMKANTGASFVLSAIALWTIAPRRSGRLARRIAAAAVWLTAGRSNDADNERRRLEEKGRQSDEVFRSFAEHSADGIVMADGEGRIVLFNASAEEMLGFTGDEVVGQPVEMLLPARLRDYHREHREEFLTSVTARRMSEGYGLTARRKDGSELPVGVSLTPLQTEEGDFVVAYITDVSASTDVQEQLHRTVANLQRSNAELEQFAYVASHDLQEPLRMVSNFTQLLAHRYGDKLDDDAREFIDFAVDGATRMQQLVQDLLTLSRVGTRGGDPKPIDTQRVLEGALRDLGEAISESGAVVTHGPLPAIMMDEGQLEQLLQNLIGNAIKFHGDDAPRVAVSATRNGAGWRFAVRDNGIGIDPQFADRIFVIFQRLHGREQYAGTGIGLAICKKIVERHGGRIWVKSEAGRGATFYFTVPAVDSNPKSNAA